LKLKVDHVAVCHDVLFAFQAQLGGFAALGFAAQLDQVLPAHDLGADEAALDVGVDLARGLLRAGAGADGPGAALVFARGEQRDQIDERVGGADETPGRGLGQAERRHEFLLLLGRHLRDVHFHRAGQHHQTQADSRA
jgi:hypothetical protein